MNEAEKSRQVHGDLTGGINTNEKKYLSNRLVFNEGYDSLLNHHELSNQSFLIKPNCEKGDEENYVDDSCKSTEINESTGYLPGELKSDTNEDNNVVKMNLKKECSLTINDPLYPTLSNPETDGTPEVKSNQDCASIGTGHDNSRGTCLDNVNNKRISSNPGIATTSRNNSKESKMRISTDDDTNFDIFEYMKCSDDEVTDCSKSYCDKDDLALNEDLVNKYEKNLGLDIVKDKDICWAAGNFDSEVCSLKNYDICNENSMLNFSREIPDDENQETFSQEWGFDENIDCISQEHVPDSYVIVPKKTVDITKIKGWRKKQFTVEKCLANKNSLLKKVNVKLEAPEETSQQDLENGVTMEGIVSEEQNKDYAFVCDKLDDFLNEEAELKINYEIPHLYAEYGIKLTSEELVSRPKFKLSTVSNRLPVRNVRQNTLSEKPANVPFDYSESTGTDEKQLSNTSLIKKPNQKTKCAFPNKSHKNWSLWKENNLSKGKPMSLLKKEWSVKRENRGDVGFPCRRSGRISQAALSKNNMGVNPAVNEQKIQLRDRFKVEAADGDSKPVTTSGMPILDFGSEYSFQIRKFGVVLYPGPSAPLNPFITSHLQKIRSYRTLIDKRWANFAVSAVVQKGKTENRKRMILPVTCCFKYKNETRIMHVEGNDCKVEGNQLNTNSAGSKDCVSDVEVNVNDKEFASGRKERLVRRNSGHSCKKEMLENSDVDIGHKILGKRRSSLNRLSIDSALSRKINDGKFDLYEEEIKCKDVKDDIDVGNVDTNDNGLNHLKIFSEDSDFYSKKCDIVFEKRKQKTSISNCIKENSKNSPEVIDIEDDDTELSTTVHLSADAGQNAFNKVIAKLLTKKLNELKQTENLTSSIDNLKTVKFNGLELIKLNFIKENYLSGYINLWYMKTPDTGKSRVFLTFSMNPPVEGAINLKMMSRCSESDPPNIIQEIITKDKAFDSNDFAILYCDGKHWEIHGSVNFEMGKNYSEIEGNDKIQVFHLTKKVFPELEMLHDIKQKSDKNKVLKWWVMHMMQDYTEITVRCGEKIGRISRSIIIKTWKTKVPSFIEFKGLDNVRPIGVGVNPRLWPYFLIGPYHMGDHHNLTLKLNSKIVPFEYYLPLDRVKAAFLLKRFVSSVIMHSWRNCRQVVGMWLYDRIAMKQSSFIQVRTRMKKSGSYEPSIEHDYSLCKPSVGLFESKANHNQRPNMTSGTKGSQPTREIFLVSDVPHLGYVKGELHPDRSITIQHPLKPDRKRNSHRIGDWLNRIMRKRIKFYPDDFYVKWKIVKNAESIHNLEPLDRSYFGGTHILCSKGIFYLLSLTKEKIAKLGLNEAVVMDAILNNTIIQEVVEVKELGKILLKKDSCDLPMSEVLQLALYEIERLEKEAISLRKSRVTVEEERASLCRKFLEALERCEIDENSKRTIDFYVTGILEGSKVNEEEIPDSKKEKENFRRLEAINRFLQSLELSGSHKNTQVSEPHVKATKEAEETLGDETKKNAIGREKFESDNEKVKEQVKELESKIKTLHENLSKISGDDGSLREMLAERLNAMSQHLEKMKRSHNTNGKLSPVIGEIICTVAEPRGCQVPLRSTDNTKKEDGNVGFRKGTVEFDTSPSDPVRFKDKGESLEITDKLNKEEENNNESCQNVKNKVNSMLPVSEKNPALVKITSPNLSILPKIYGRERQSPPDDNHRSFLNKSKKMESNFGGIMVEEITLEESEAHRERFNENLNCNGSENIPGSTRDNQHKSPEMVKKDGSKVEEIRRGREVLVIDDMRLKRLKNLKFKNSEGKLFGNMGKRVRLKFLKPSSLADGKASAKFNGRIEYLDGKQVLIVNNKRKRDGYNDFLKKLRTS